MLLFFIQKCFSFLQYNIRKFTIRRIFSWIKMDMSVKFTKSCKLKRERFKMSRFSEFLSTFHHHREISMIMNDEVRNISFLQAINKNISTNNPLSKSTYCTLLFHTQHLHHKYFFFLSSTFLGFMYTFNVIFNIINTTIMKGVLSSWKFDFGLTRIIIY